MTHLTATQRAARGKAKLHAELGLSSPVIFASEDRGNLSEDTVANAERLRAYLVAARQNIDIALTRIDDRTGV